MCCGDNIDYEITLLINIILLIVVFWENGQQEFNSKQNQNQNQNYFRQFKKRSIGRNV